MVGYKAIHVGSIVIMLVICYDTGYLLVEIDGENGGGSKRIIQPRLKIKGSISLNLGYKIKRNIFHITKKNEI